MVMALLVYLLSAVSVFLGLSWCYYMAARYIGGHTKMPPELFWASVVIPVIGLIAIAVYGWIFYENRQRGSGYLDWLAKKAERR